MVATTKVVSFLSLSSFVGHVVFSGLFFVAEGDEEIKTILLLQYTWHERCVRRRWEQPRFPPLRDGNVRRDNMTNNAS